MRRRTFHIYLSLLAAFLLGTVIVLSSFSYYLAIDNAAYLSEDDLDVQDIHDRWNATQHGKVERIPRILHQTWKSDTLPSEWKGISEACREMMPDYEYMLWTDEGSRNFIAEHYAWFLKTFDSYTYPIQRADVIRYFVLYHYGGVYLDLDIGCRRPLDPLLVYSVILAKTIPVGVSNDLMFAERNHSFMAQTIHNLASFDHSWVLNYPTVMFSTGPMFLSAQYGLYSVAHPAAPNSVGDIRILPKSLYGKNIKPVDAPLAFFSHFYGSSWHADDAAFIWFLGTWGKGLMLVGLIVLVLGLGRLAIPSHKRRRIGGYEVVLPRWTKRNGRWHLDLGWFSLPSSGNSQYSLPVDSPISETHLPLLPMQLDVRSSMSTASSDLGEDMPLASPLVETARRMRLRLSSVFGSHNPPRTNTQSLRSRQPRGVLYFLPAIFPPGRNVEAPSTREYSLHSHDSTPISSPPLLHKGVLNDDIDIPDMLPLPASIRTGRLFSSSSDDGSSSSMSWTS